MTILPTLPALALLSSLMLGSSAILDPGSPAPIAPNPAERPALAHPHHPMVSELACVKGKLKVSWFTVPFNPDEVAKNKRANYLWSRGFSLTTEVDLQCGAVKVAAGRYALGFQLDGEAKNWSVVLMPAAAAQLKRQLRNAKRRGRDTAAIETKLAALQKQGPIANLTVPCKVFKGQHAEHMAVQLISHGYRVKGRRDPQPAGGVSAEFRVSFGDLHTSFPIQEVFAAAPSKGPAK